MRREGGWEGWGVAKNLSGMGYACILSKNAYFLSSKLTRVLTLGGSMMSFSSTRCMKHLSFALLGLSLACTQPTSQGDSGGERPSRPSSAKADNSNIEWLCEDEPAVNGICLEICLQVGIADPDCANREPEPEACSEGYDDRDGHCNEFCYPNDDDCRIQRDLCYDQLRYGDRICDQDCAFPDPDCGGEIGSGAISASEERICSDFPAGSLGRDLAISLCMGRAAADRPECIVACVRANPANRGPIRQPEQPEQPEDPNYDWGAGDAGDGGNQAGWGDADQGVPAAGDDSCFYANDGACDEPYLCAEGTDTTDCR